MLDRPVSLPLVQQAEQSEALKACWYLLDVYEELPHYSALTYEQKILVPINFQYSKRSFQNTSSYRESDLT